MATKRSPRKSDPVEDQELVREDPAPRRGRSARVWEKRLAPLKEEPGVWYRVYRAKKTSVPSIKDAAGVRDEFKAGLWEFTTRKDEDDAGYVLCYARYVGD